MIASPNNGGAYKVWVTPVTSFVGDPTQVDNSCGTGCFHGFVPSATKTDNFKVNVAPGTFCLTLVKQDQNSQPVVGWQFSLTDQVGASNIYSTDSTGTVPVCGLVAGPYTVSEAQAVSDTGSTVIGLTVAGLIGGAIVTETVFALPGVGNLVVSAVLRRDYPVIQGALLIVAAIYVLINLVIDVIYTLVDPRVRT